MFVSKTVVRRKRCYDVCDARMYIDDSMKKKKKKDAYSIGCREVVLYR